MLGVLSDLCPKYFTTDSIERRLKGDGSGKGMSGQMRSQVFIDTAYIGYPLNRHLTFDCSKQVKEYHYQEHPHDLHIFLLFP
ncbi:MAG: hypothetical protein R2821_09740 [Flavobacteriaceae bacterium]